MNISIITINFNNPEGLERTISSIASQSVPPYEYIIVDGGSTKGDVDIIRKYEKNITKWVSEKDNGIYSAINKGTRMASGDYCLFINSGDTLYSQEVISQLIDKQYTEDFIEGRVFTMGRISPIIQDYTLKTFVINRCNPYHQGSLIKRELILKYPYDESYRIAGDLAFNVNCLIQHNCSYRSIDIIIANYEDGGISCSVNHNEELSKSFEWVPERIKCDYKNNEWQIRFPARQILPLLEAFTEFISKIRGKDKSILPF